jgi:anti-sigma-K factor RskA
MASLALILIMVTSNLLLWRQVNTLSARQANMQIVNLSGTNAAPAATALIVISLDGQHGTLVADDLPPLSEQQQYQLWLIDKDGKRTSGGIFSVKDGYGSVWVHSSQPLISYPAFGVTIEPKGGSPAPTGEKVLGGQL